MTVAIIIFAVLTLFTGIVIVLNPQFIFGFLNNKLDNLVLHIMAVVVRLILGILFINQAGASKFPLAIEIIGWLSIVAAILFTAIGHKNFKRLITWALSLSKPFARMGGAIAICFGTFLLYAFI